MPLHWRSLPLSQRFSLRFFFALVRASREWQRERKRPSPCRRPFATGFRGSAARSLSRRENKFQEKPLRPGYAFLSCNDNIDLKREEGSNYRIFAKWIVWRELQSSGIFWFMFFHCMGVKTLLPLILPANQSPKTHPLHTWATPPVRPQHRSMKTLAETRREKIC